VTGKVPKIPLPNGKGAFGGAGATGAAGTTGAAGGAPGITAVPGSGVAMMAPLLAGPLFSRGAAALGA